MGHDTHHPHVGGFSVGQGLNINHEYKCHSQIMFKHVGLISIGKKHVPLQPTSRPNHRRPQINKVITINNKGNG